MDDTRPDEASGLSERAIQELPPGFFPLRLLLQPSNAPVDISQPDTLIGRHSTCDIRLPLPDVSRKHCRLLFTEGSWQVIDLKSMNGVYVNEVPIHTALLKNGDLLRIGGFSFAIKMERPTVATEEDNGFKTMPFPPPQDYRKAS